MYRCDSRAEVEFGRANDGKFGDLTGVDHPEWQRIYFLVHCLSNSLNLASATLSSNRISATIDAQALSAAGVSTGTVNISVTNAGQIMGGILGCPNGGDSKIIPITIE
jgi:hypothetical protein